MSGRWPPALIGHRQVHACVFQEDRLLDLIPPRVMTSLVSLADISLIIRTAAPPPLRRTWVTGHPPISHFQASVFTHNFSATWRSAVISRLNGKPYWRWSCDGWLWHYFLAVRLYYLFFKGSNYTNRAWFLNAVCLRKDDLQGHDTATFRCFLGKIPGTIPWKSFV